MVTLIRRSLSASDESGTEEGVYMKLGGNVPKDDCNKPKKTDDALELITGNPCQETLQELREIARTQGGKRSRTGDAGQTRRLPGVG